MPLPGTLVASETEEVEPIPDFQQITLTQQGGRNNTVIRIDIYADGRVVWGDQTGFVDANTIAELNQAIRELNFFGLQGTYLGPPSNNDGYTYRIVVNSGVIERAINGQDGFMPAELIRFLGMVRSIGDSVVA